MPQVAPRSKEEAVMSHRIIALESWLYRWGAVGTVWGNYPIQGEWNLPSRMWAYFRARHENWELSVWAHPPRSGESLPPEEAEIWFHRGRVPGSNLGALTPDAACDYIWMGFREYLRQSGARDEGYLNLEDGAPPWSNRPH
jgi:hypothetical protein